MQYEKGLIVGGGAVGVNFHAPRLLELMGVEKLHVIDNSEMRIAHLKDRYQGDKRIVVSSSIDADEFDIAVIATPPKFHLPTLGDVAQRCKNIVIEKPVARTLSEAQEMDKICQQQGVKAYVAHIRRALGSFKWMKSSYESGAFGKLESVQLNEGSVFSWDAVSIGSFSKELNGGGVLMDTGPHAIDQLFQVFTDLTVVRVKMDALPRKSNTAIEANAVLELIADDQIPVVVALSRNRVFSNQIVFQYEKIDVGLSLHNNTIIIRDKSGAEMQGTPGKLKEPMSYTQLFDTYYTDFVISDNNTGITIEEALKTQSIIDQSYECASLIKGGF